MFGKRYIAIAVSIFAIGVVFGVKVFNIDTFSLCAIFAVIAVLSACAFAYFAFFANINYKKIIAATFAVAAFSFGVLRVGLYDISASSLNEFHGKEDNASFELIEIKENYVDLKVVLSDIGVEKGEKVRLYTYSELDELVSGDIVYANVKYKFQDSESYYSNNIALSANGEVIKTENGEGLFCSARRKVFETSAELYEDFEFAEVISNAVTCGDKSGIDSYLYAVYGTSGVSHILAISGLHVTMIAMCLYRLLLLLSVNKKISGYASSLAILIYAAFVGFTPSITRASFMLIAIMLAKMFMSRADSITMLFVALALLLVLNPYSLFSVSLQLSFAASLAILAIEPILDRISAFFKEKGEDSGKRTIKFLYSSFNALITPALLSFVTSAFSFGIVLTTFDSVSYISPLTNIVVVPIFSYALIFALIAIIVSTFCMPLAVIIAKPAGYIFDLITNFSETIHKADIGKLSSHVDWIIIPCALALLMVVALLFFERRRIKSFVILSAAFCISIAVCGFLNSYTLRGLTIIEYGDNDSKYVFFRDDEHEIYYDFGGYSAKPETVFKNGLTSLEKYVVTCYDDYTLKNFNLFSGKLSLTEIYLPTPEKFYEIDIYNEIKLLANKRKCVIIEYNTEINIETYQFDIHLINAKQLNNAKLLSFTNRYETINVFIDDFPAVNNYDIAIFDRYSEDYLIDARLDRMYFKNDDVYNTSHIGYINTFDDTLRITYYDGESDKKIYEP